MQDSGSHNETQGDHNYVARRTRSTSSEDSSIEFNNSGRRRERFRRGRVRNTDHDYIAIRAISEDDNGGDVETEAEPNAEHSDETQPDNEEDNNDIEDIDPVNGLAEAAQEALARNTNDDDAVNAVSHEPTPLDPMAGSSIAVNVAVPNGTGSIVNLATPSPPKKRKRLTGDTPKSNTPRVNALTGSGADGDEEDEGMTCPICLDNWEMSGEHRLVSLRCGHLFGDACIRRWLAESARQSGFKACPQCKTKATNRDIRCLYAKRLRAIDRSEEHRLRDELDEERRRSQSLQTEIAALKMTHKVVVMQLQTIQDENDRIKRMLRAGAGGGSFSYEAELGDDKQLLRLQMQRLYLERTIEITREPGCRVLIHAERHSSILASQKSAQGLFPGFGIRFIDEQSFRTSTFLHASLKLIRDMCLNSDQQLLAVASMETRSKLFDLRSRQVVSIFEPGEKALWACAMNRKDRENVLYLGGSNGSTYTYDMRFSDNILEEYKTDGDLSTVINVASVSVGTHFPYGGFLVCKLQSIWFYEYVNGGDMVIPTRLSIEGPFSSMHFDPAQETLLVSARCSVRYPQSRYIVGRLEKVDGTTVLNVKVTFNGSKATPVMTRCTQVAIEANTLVAGYMQDVKQLALFDVRREQRIQTLPAQEVIYDICPIHVSNGTYLAGLSETKCRMYKLTSTNN
ncbi:E3 ubiquitin-protein ligase RFWD3 isoform X1 [Anastrepha obliqua]|uniref:E3 ubiquitin-protein ligase RFWD3 isoform X1 n=1 Tax=Anastrepha obliqua TaxID=95512 RepID=UPI0024092315|nr:E3 ubiquitin-protein ligase RFWD3 isoform X1 [Anastrepha obliqua]